VLLDLFADLILQENLASFACVAMKVLLSQMSITTIESFSANASVASSLGFTPRNVFFAADRFAHAT
jgi:hypothetical protein